MYSIDKYNAWHVVSNRCMGTCSHGYCALANPSETRSALLSSQGKSHIPKSQQQADNLWPDIDLQTSLLSPMPINVYLSNCCVGKQIG